MHYLLFFIGGLPRPYPRDLISSDEQEPGTSCNISGKKSAMSLTP